MKKIKKTLLTLTSMFLVGIFAFGYAKASNKETISQVKAEDGLSINDFNGIASGWNPNSSDFDKGYCHYVFEFKNAWGTSADKSDASLNSSVGQHVYLNGTALSTLSETDAKVHYGHGGKYFAIKIKKELIVPAIGNSQCVLTIDEGTPFFSYALPELTFEIDPSTYVCIKSFKKAPFGTLPLNEFKSVASGWNPNSSDFTNGYCHYVFEFKNKWGTDGDKSDASLNSYVGPYVYINGTAFSTLDDSNAKIHYGHGGKYFAIKIKKELVVPAEGRDVCLIHVDEGASFFNYALPNFNVEIDCSTYVATVIKDPVRMPLESISVNWRNTIWGASSHNNLLESEYEPNPILKGGNYYPANGYCALLSFDPKNDNAKYNDEQNFAYDENYEFSTKMKVNGVQVKDVQGVKVNGILGYLFFYICDSTLPNKDLYKYPTVEFEDGIRMGDFIFPHMTYEYVGKIGTDGDWNLIKVTNRGIVWNKENKDSAVFGNKKGLLIGLDKEIFDGTSENMLNEFGTHASLNGVSFKNLTNPEIIIYDSSYLWFYADEMNTANEDVNVIHFDFTDYNGQPIESFNYYRQSGDNSYWSSRTSDEKQQLTVKYNADRNYWGSDWPSGHVYLSSGHNEYCGGNYKSGTKEGYLLSFNEKISKNSEEYGGKLKYTNLVKENIGHHIYSKGVPLCDIDGAEIMYHSTGNLWIWEPNMACPYEGKNYAEIYIEGGTLFFDSELPDIHIYHEDYKDLGNFTNGNPWRIKGYEYNGELYKGPANDQAENYLRLDEKTPDVDTWLGPFSWNNHDGDGTVLICYGSNPGDYDAVEDGITEPTYLRNDKQPNMFNVGTKDFAIGWKLKFNGLPIWKIDGASVSYQNGDNYLTINIPVKYTIPFNGYKVPTLTLENGTNFHDVSLQGFEIYFNSNGKWQKQYIPSVSNEELNAATKFTEVFDNTIFSNNVTSAEGVKNLSSNDFAFEFTSNDSNAAFALNLFGKDKEHSLGVVVDLNSDTLIVSDNSNGSRQLGDGTYSFTYNTGEWNRFYISANFENGKMHVVIAIDDVIITDISDVEVGNIDNFGNVIYLYTNGADIEFSDVRTSASIKRPEIIYTGKNLYRFHVGDEMPNLLPLLSASDMLTDITSSIVLQYSEGMFDNNNKLAKGDHLVKAIATSSIGISSVKEIRVLVTLPDEVVVTFDENNPTTYKIGDKIEKPENPTKPSVDGVDYEFAYWEYNGEEWDFDNYYVTQDINLVSKFTESNKLYTVKFVSEGLPTNFTLDFKYILGANISFSFLEKEGYAFEVFDEGEKISSFKVSGDDVLTVKYTQIAPTPEPNPDPDPGTGNKRKPFGCKGSIVLSSFIVSTIAICSTILISLRKKEEK